MPHYLEIDTYEDMWFEICWHFEYLENHVPGFQNLSILLVQKLLIYWKGIMQFCNRAGVLQDQTW